MKRKENVPVMQQVSIKKFFGCAAKKPVNAAPLPPSTERLDAASLDAKDTCTELDQPTRSTPEAGNVTPNCEVVADVSCAPSTCSEGKNAAPLYNKQLETSSSPSDDEDEARIANECQTALCPCPVSCAGEYQPVSAGRRRPY